MAVSGGSWFYVFSSWSTLVIYAYWLVQTGLDGWPSAGKAEMDMLKHLGQADQKW